ncbi:MAG: hypothetical protein Q8K58_14695 [Acidimicrobiales bacterium]|nr:hypothetical protein [Acidimicrobiales bacterium]
MRRPWPPLLVLALAVGACSEDDSASSGDGEATEFCGRLDRLARNDPFGAFGNRATPAEIQQAFTALVSRAGDLLEVAPAEARPAARDYAEAAAELDSLMAGAAYDGSVVDSRAYREQQVAYTGAAGRLERHLETEC